MKKIKWTLSIGFPTATRTGEVEVEDSATEKDIEEAVRDDMWNIIDLGWEEVEA